MINNLFNSTTIPVLEQVVNFAQKRHQVLAGNIANLDTPGYHTRDLSSDAFEANLRDAIEHRRDQSTSFASVAEDLDPFAPVKAGMAGILRHDDDNVGLEQQLMQTAKNQMQHNIAMTILNNQLQLIGAAISERA
ncbi:MAG TPA: flagellar basal body rod protein FlgB [Pirellulales bacterium]|nr:flagellar basal body rod protein FlgB [Pirellulales bacterium]